MKRILIWITLLFSVCCFAEPTKLIYDNDAGGDDAIALIYLAHQANMKIEALTIAGTGEAHGLQGARNMANICYLLGKPSIPIAFGRETSYDGLGHPFPDFLRELTDKLLVGKHVPQHPNPRITDSAVELMREITEKNNKISILATGPLTNVADFIEKYPHLKNKIEKIFIMGGAVHVKGNIQALDPTSDNTVAEWNIYADPKAAQIVFTSQIPVTLVPLDATNQVPMTKKFYETLSKESQPELKLIYLMLKDIIDSIGLEAFLRDFYLWDPLSAIIISDPTRAKIETFPMVIDLKTAQTKHVDDTSPAFSMIHVATHIPHAELVLDRLINDLKK